MSYPRALRSVEDRFWAGVGHGLSVEKAALQAGIVTRTGYVWVHRRGGIAPRRAAHSGRYLSLVEREEIAIGVAQGKSLRQIARERGRDPGTISREIVRNSVNGRPGGYRAVKAQGRAEARGTRPKQRRLLPGGNQRLRAEVEAGLEQRWSPQQISRRMVDAFPQDESMRASHETIYQALYVQGRGGLRRELQGCLRTGRAIRRPQRRELGDGGQHGIPEKVMISERPAEVADRAIPGHWEGDLIIGKDGKSAIGTLVERSTRYVQLLHLPRSEPRAEEVAAAMGDAIGRLPKHLWRSLTWDQGTEMARHREITFAHDLPIYFCDPHSPWQRGSNENTNGLLRQYFPKGSDLSVHTRDDLDAVAVQLNGRPRQTLDWATPAERLNQLLSTPFEAGVATTT